ncbi:MAG: hypothetical protein JWR75_1037 [Devosia sp.]|nr:hypothetical protein [Devosia sp.]
MAPHRWLFSVFACPSQANVGFNCYDTVTTPGTANPIRIIVRQGGDIVVLTPTFNAIAPPGGGANACGFTVGSVILDKWLELGGAGGPLGCARSDEQETARSVSGAEARRPSGLADDAALEQRWCETLPLGLGAGIECEGQVGDRSLPETVCPIPPSMTCNVLGASPAVIYAALRG